MLIPLWFTGKWHHTAAVGCMTSPLSSLPLWMVSATLQPPSSAVLRTRNLLLPLCVKKRQTGSGKGDAWEKRGQNLGNPKDVSVIVGQYWRFCDCVSCLTDLLASVTGSCVFTGSLSRCLSSGAELTCLSLTLSLDAKKSSISVVSYWHPFWGYQIH